MPAAVAAFLWTTQVLAPAAIVLALLLTAIAMATASTVCGALLVENGQRLSASAAFINQQWLWFNVAVMVASLAGGELIEILSPAGALHAAAAIAAAAPIAVIASSIALVDEQRAAMNVAEFQRALRGFLDCFRSRTLWLIAAFLFCYYFSPGFGTPLYFYMTDHLRFSQGTIGLLSSVSAGGWIVGGLVYRYLLRGMTTRALLNLSILGGTLATLAFLGMVDVHQRHRGVFRQRRRRHDRQHRHVDPGRRSLSGTLGRLRLRRADVGDQPGVTAPDTIGAFLYQHLFHETLAPLIVVSAAFTALIFLLVPLLGREIR